MWHLLFGAAVALDGLRQVHAALVWADGFGLPWAVLDVLAGIYILMRRNP